MTKLPYLNLGCGVTYDPRWTNVDFTSTGPGVIAHNLLTGIPFPDKSFDVVYHSHILEHFPKDKSRGFMRECHRVLKPGGTFRVAIPDLEQIAVNYLRYLNEGVANVPGAKEKYEWMVIELVDQMVRNESGGEMLKYVADPSRNNDAFIVSRCGQEVARLIEAVRENHESNGTAAVEGLSFHRRVVRKLKRTLARRLLGDEPELLALARFRTGGEIHQWMFDRFSLGELLRASGFKNPAVCSAFESAIPEWSQFKLDAEDNAVRKPDSLFMEARRDA